MDELVLLAQGNRRISLSCDGRRFAAELMHPQGDCSR